MDAPLQNRPGAKLGLRLGFAGAIVIAFVALLSFATAEPAAMMRPAIGPVPLSLVLAVAMIAYAVLVTGLYVFVADRSAS